MPFNFDGRSGNFSDCVKHFKTKGKSQKAASGLCATIMRKQEDEKMKILYTETFETDSEEHNDMQTEEPLCFGHRPVLLPASRKCCCSANDAEYALCVGKTVKPHGCSTDSSSRRVE